MEEGRAVAPRPHSQVDPVPAVLEAIVLDVTVATESPVGEDDAVRGDDLDDRVDIVRARRLDDGHDPAGTSSSSTDGSGPRSRSSRSGSGSASSPRRLIHTERNPSSRAGATSWNRLAA